MARTKAQESDRTEAREKLLAILRPGMTVNCILRHVSRSGMQREISLVVATIDRGAAECYARDEHRTPKHGKCPRCGSFEENPMVPDVDTIDYWVSRALGYRIGSHGGIVMGGCGMDMGFSLVYNLGSALWPNGTPTPHGTRNREPDSTGGYALKSRWL